MDERKWLYEKTAERVIANLKKNGMKGFYFPTAQEAVPEIMGNIPEGAVVGIGDSLTLKQIDLISAVERSNCRLLDPWAAKDIESKEDLQRRIFGSDVFLTGANAVTLRGELINVDGRGNRVAAMIFGPRKVLVVVGANKIVRDVEEGFDRVKTIAGPANARRHKFPEDQQPPCASSGFCSECRGPLTICCALTIIRGQRTDPNRIKVFIIGEELGL